MKTRSAPLSLPLQFTLLSLPILSLAILAILAIG